MIKVVSIEYPDLSILSRAVITDEPPYAADGALAVFTKAKVVHGKIMGACIPLSVEELRNDNGAFVTANKALAKALIAIGYPVRISDPQIKRVPEKYVVRAIRTHRDVYAAFEQICKDNKIPIGEVINAYIKALVAGDAELYK